MNRRSEPLKATRAPVRPTSQSSTQETQPAIRLSPTEEDKPAWLPVHTVAIIVAAATMFAVLYNLNQQGHDLDALNIGILLDVVFSAAVNVGLVYLAYLPITWAWHRYRN